MTMSIYIWGVFLSYSNIWIRWVFRLLDVRLHYNVRPSNSTLVLMENSYDLGCIRDCLKYLFDIDRSAMIALQREK